MKRVGEYDDFASQDTDSAACKLRSIVVLCDPASRRLRDGRAANGMKTVRFEQSKAVKKSSKSNH